jgi:hypothetical protein
MSESGRSCPSHSFKDLRSASVTRNRNKKQSRKYFKFSSVNGGQLGALHYHFKNENTRQSYLWPAWPADLEECPVVVLKRRHLYLEAKNLAIQRGLHCRCCTECDKFSRAEAERQEVAAKIEAKAWSKKKMYADFALHDNRDLIFYDEIAQMDSEIDHWCISCSCSWCCDHTSDEEYCPFHSSHELGSRPTEFLNLALLLDAALEKRNQAVKAEFAELGWSEIDSVYLYSPEMEWADDGEELFGEEFELL